MKKLNYKAARNFGSFLGYLLIAGAISGEIRCVVKAINCNWEPIGKAEVIYTAGVFTGAGCVIGWFDIEDK
jgi:hypothetical protein